MRVPSLAEAKPPSMSPSAERRSLQLLQEEPDNFQEEIPSIKVNPLSTSMTKSDSLSTMESYKTALEAVVVNSLHYRPPRESQQSNIPMRRKGFFALA